MRDVFLLELVLLIAHFATHNLASNAFDILKSVGRNFLRRGKKQEPAATEQTENAAPAEGAPAAAAPAGTFLKYPKHGIFIICFPLVIARFFYIFDEEKLLGTFSGAGCFEPHGRKTTDRSEREKRKAVFQSNLKLCFC